MKIDIDYEDRVITGRTENGDSFSSFGGEYWDGDYHHDSYGLQFQDIMIVDIPSEKFEQLAINMLNHLFTNDHDYIIDKNYNGYFIKKLTLHTRAQYGHKNRR